MYFEILDTVVVFIISKNSSFLFCHTRCALKFLRILVDKGIKYILTQLLTRNSKKVYKFRFYIKSGDRIFLNSS